MTVDDRAEQLAEVYLLVGPLYRRVLRVVERAEAENRVPVGVRGPLAAGPVRRRVSVLDDCCAALEPVVRRYTPAGDDVAGGWVLLRRTAA